VGLRIIAGDLGGRRLTVPKGQKVRPTSERVREAIFSILGDRVHGARVLDLFAGSGAMGFEALSRGAARAVMIEAAPDSVRAIRQNARALGVIDRVEIVPGDARLGPGPEYGPFDLIFADPPYGLGAVAEVLEAVGRRKGLVPDGIMIVEHAREVKSPEATAHLNKSDQRHYGRTAISLYVPNWTEKEDSSP
jgi:16S rRNA (guanine(966)-N(2))-methyltransferase RsmD